MNNQGMLTSQIAILVDHFHLTLDEVGNLTPYQIDKIYFHKRDKDGNIDAGGKKINLDVDKSTVTFDQLMMEGHNLFDAKVIDKEAFEKYKADLRKKYNKPAPPTT